MLTNVPSVPRGERHQFCTSTNRLNMGDYAMSSPDFSNWSEIGIFPTTKHRSVRGPWSLLGKNTLNIQGQGETEEREVAKDSLTPLI